MLADAIELLDRQVGFLLKQDGRDFFMHLPAFIEALRSEPRLDAIFEDLLGEARQQLEVINGRRLEVKESLWALRERLNAEFPEASARQGARDGEGDDDEGALSVFEKLAEKVPERWPNERRIDTATDALQHMIGVLDSKVEDVDPKVRSPQAQPIRIAVGNARRQFEHVRRDYQVAAKTSPAVAVLRLVGASGQINPQPVIQHVPLTMSELFKYAFGEMWGAGGAIRRYLYSRETKPEDQLRVRELRHGYRKDVGCFYMEARRRIGLQRSLRSVVDRYKMRAEWHDAAALRELAKKRPAKKGANANGRVKAPIGKVEVTLTANFARSLHDQGLNPLTKIRAGGLEPDVLAPFADRKIRWTFYAEAKQYSKACVPYLAAGIREIADHLTRLRGTDFEVHEAFYMVFRLGGPLYHLPESVRLGDVTVYPVLIDIADPKKSGSRQRVAPVVVTVEELLLAARERTRARPTARAARGKRRAS